MLFPGALGLGLTYMSERKAVLGLVVSRPSPTPTHSSPPGLTPLHASLGTAIPTFQTGKDNAPRG